MALQALLARLAGLLLVPERSPDTSAAVSATKLALSLASRLALSEASAATASAGGDISACQATVLIAMMDFIMAPPHAIGAARAAVKAAKSLTDDSPSRASPVLKAFAPALAAYVETDSLESPPGVGNESESKKARKERRARQAIELREATVAALATAVSQQPLLADDLLVLAERAVGDVKQQHESGVGDAVHSHLHARHLILLALNAALAVPPSAAGGKAGSKFSVKTPAGGRGSGGGSSRAAPSPSYPTPQQASIAAALRELCASEIEAMVVAADAGRGTSKELLFDPEWHTRAKELLTSPSEIPTEAHLAQSRDSMQEVHATLLCQALENALKATAAEASLSDGRDVTSTSAAELLLGSFFKVAALEPVAAFEGHLMLLLQVSLPLMNQRQAFLQVSDLTGDDGFGPHVKAAYMM